MLQASEAEGEGVKGRVSERERVKGGSFLFFLSFFLYSSPASSSLIPCDPQFSDGSRAASW